MSVCWVRKDLKVRVSRALRSFTVSVAGTLSVSRDRNSDIRSSESGFLFLASR